MTHLVQYGRLGFVGSFEASSDFTRGDRIVIHGPRGIEIGSLLVPAPPGMPIEGDILRLANPVDFAAAERQEALGHKILTATENAGLSITFIDIELTLDGSAAILHGLPWDVCDPAELLDTLSRRFGIEVRWLDLSQAAAAKDPVGCGKPGCGAESGGCTSCGSGCSTGSCSSGSVKSAGELTAYFADLRRQMEAAGLARTPLV